MAKSVNRTHVRAYQIGHRAGRILSFPDFTGQYVATLYKVDGQVRFLSHQVPNSRRKLATLCVHSGYKGKDGLTGRRAWLKVVREFNQAGPGFLP